MMETLAEEPQSASIPRRRTLALMAAAGIAVATGAAGIAAAATDRTTDDAERPVTLAWTGPAEDGGVDLPEILASLPLLDQFLGDDPAEPIWLDGCPACGMG